MNPKQLVTLLFLPFIFLTSGCDSDDDDDDYVATEVEVTVVNAIPDSPLLTLEFTILRGETDEEVEIEQLVRYEQAVRQSVEILDASMAVSYEDPDTGSDLILINDTPLSLNSNSRYFAILSGRVTTPTLELVELSEDFEGDDDTAELVLMNVSSLEPAEIRDGTTTLATLSPGGSQTSFISSGSLNLSVLGTDGESFSTTEIDILSENRRLLLVTDDLLNDTSDLFIADISGAITSLPNQLIAPSYRVLNGVPNESTLSVEVSDSFSDELLTRFDLSYGASTDYLAAPEDSVFLNLDYGPPGDLSAFTIASFDQDTHYTIVLGGNLEDSSSSRIVATEENPTATETRVTFINAADITSTVDSEEQALELDFYILESTDSIQDDSPLASRLEFLDSDASMVASVPVIIVATDSETDTIVAGPEPFILEPMTSALISVIEAPGGGFPLGLSVQTTAY